MRSSTIQLHPPNNLIRSPWHPETHWDIENLEISILPTDVDKWAKQSGWYYTGRTYAGSGDQKLLKELLIARFFHVPNIGFTIGDDEMIHEWIKEVE
jgi:hypothetical protein